MKSVNIEGKKGKGTGWSADSIFFLHMDPMPQNLPFPPHTKQSHSAANT